MKTRTNQPIDLASTADIEHLSDGFLSGLKCGDIITKQTGNQKHTYVVTYKEENHGICLTYVACGYMETISYDFTDGHWVFNSKDVIEVPTSAGSQLYLHSVSSSYYDEGEEATIQYELRILSAVEEEFENFDDMLDNSLSFNGTYQLGNNPNQYIIQLFTLNFNPYAITISDDGETIQRREFPKNTFSQYVFEDVAIPL